MLEAIVAVNRDWGIGADGTQNVVLHADRKHFRAVTEGCAVIVGRRTLADFPGGRPLPNRRNIVLTRGDLTIDGAEVAHTVEEALALAGSDRCLVIGGASVYRTLLPYCERIYVTKIDACPPSDSFFPDLDASSDWEIEHESEEMEENGVRFRFVDYIRK